MAPLIFLALVTSSLTPSRSCRSPWRSWTGSHQQAHGKEDISDGVSHGAVPVGNPFRASAQG